MITGDAIRDAVFMQEIVDNLKTRLGYLGLTVSVERNKSAGGYDATVSDADQQTGRGSSDYPLAALENAYHNYRETYQQ